MYIYIYIHIYIYIYIYIYIWYPLYDGYRQMSSSNLDKTVSISHGFNTFGKGMNPSILP